MKKRILVIGLTAVMLFGLAGCGSTNKQDGLNETPITPEFSNGYDISSRATEAEYDYSYEDYTYDDYSYGDYGNEMKAEPSAYDTDYSNASTYNSGLSTITDSAGLSEVHDNNRKMITNVNMSVETENFDKLMASIESKVRELDGYMESYNTGYYSDYYSDATNLRYAYITARIPSENLDGFVTTVEGASNVINKSSNTSDVTLNYVDTESRKKALETEYDSLLAILAKAEDVMAIIELQSRMSEVRYEIESLESQLRTYDNKVNYSSVYIDVNEVMHITPVITKKETTWDKIDAGLSNNMYKIKQGFVNTFIGFMSAIPYIAIVFIILLIILVVTVIIVKKEKKKKREYEKLCQEMQKQDSQH